ncbi:glycosyltransferase [Planctomonas sp. JC2975]|uniref:glycosyltransferase n=1 Tax=Planctomonas sp. JC2975 TaxID=2729626 RepID=UPI001473D558|nr:glycosyltransferase [Planctomonas sp. JC2975]NNC12956.1 glycosyltransferase [Planctomonas sp. JC2975]
MFVAQGLHGGGAELVVRRWASRLVELGHRVDVATTTSTPGESELDSRVTRYRMVGGHVLRRARALRSLVTTRRPDVVVSHLTRQNVFLLASLLGVRAHRRPVVAITEHSVVSLISAGSLTGALGRLAARALYPRADLGLAVSHAVGVDLLRYGISPDRIRVVANPVLHDAGGTGSACVPTTSGTIHLVLPMRLADQKQPVRGVETARELMRRGHRVRLTYFGTGLLMAETSAAAGRLGVHAEFPGWVEPWWDGCSPDDIVLLPSKVEGLGNVLIEAASAGLRAVAPSTAFGVADAIVPGLTGVLSRSSDAVDLADAVESAMSLGATDVSPWLSAFTVSASTDSLLAALRSAGMR